MLIRLLRAHVGPYRGLIGVVVVLQLVQAMANLFLPSLNADIIDDGVAQGAPDVILRLGGVMLAVTLAQVACAIGAVWVGARVAMAIGRDLRGAVFDHVQTFSAQEVGRFGAPSLITRTTNDVTQVQLVLFMTLTLIVAAPVSMVGGVVMALREDARLSWLLAVVVPVLAVVLAFAVVRMGPLFRTMQGRIDAINRIMREQLTGIRVIRAFVRDDHERRRFDGASTELMTVAVGVGRLMALVFPTVFLVMNLSSAAVIWFGALRVQDGMQVGSMVAFLSYLMQILMSVMMAVMMFMLVPRAEVAADRITEVLRTATTVVPPTAPVRAPRPSRGSRVELRGVGFRYPGADAAVLRDVDLVAEPGTTTAVVGSTGSGKTTLLKLVPRLYDATAGAVLVDGVDVRDLELQDLWRRIGIVPQRPFLFTGTIGENVRYGKDDATDDEVWDALEVAQAAEFVRGMGGLDAPVSQGGTNVSGGQRQRLSIARALVRRPGVYLFDDSFSALDYATDAALRSALAPRVRDATVVVVAQRVSTIRHADRIVVLDAGVVVGTGTHDALMTSSPTYQEIVLSQLSAEEAR